MSSDYFLHNWVSGAILETAWETDVISSKGSGAECRRQIRSKPLRTVEAHIQALDQNESTRLLMTLSRIVNQDYTMPLYTDVSVVSQDSTGTTLHMDTSYRRLYAGMKVVILPPNGGAWNEDQIATIDTVNPTSLTLTSPLVSTVVAGSLVFPRLEIDQGLNAALEFSTDRTPVLRIAAPESVGDEQLPESHDASLPPGVNIEQDLPIFEFQHEWSQGYRLTHSRRGSTVRSGRDTLTLPNPPRGYWAANIRVPWCGRDEFWSLLEFFDSRRGRLQPFWLPVEPQSFDPVAISTGFVDVVDTFNFADLENATGHIAIFFDDGHIDVGEVTDVQTVGPNKRITFTPVIEFTPDIANVTKVTLCMKARFASDVLEERWDTDKVGQAEISIVEVLDEDTHTITDIEYDPGESC